MQPNTKTDNKMEAIVPNWDNKIADEISGKINFNKYEKPKVIIYCN